jgi:hypothetical protein
MSESLGGFGVLLFGLVIVLWTLLPFAVFGIKDRQERQIKLLVAIKNELKRINSVDNNNPVNKNET